MGSYQKVHGKALIFVYSQTKKSKDKNEEQKWNENFWVTQKRRNDQKIQLFLRGSFTVKLVN